MSHDLVKQLPQDMFNPDRLPERDDSGMCFHPDYDLVYDGLGIDDEGEAASRFMREYLGLEFCCICIEDDFQANPGLEEQYERHDDSCAFWAPSKPEGEGWVLASIYIGEDGPEAWYARRKHEELPA
jgi:hypothetical protein